MILKGEGLERVRAVYARVKMGTSVIWAGVLDHNHLLSTEYRYWLTASHFS